jgi:hypothetical protein
VSVVTQALCRSKAFEEVLAEARHCLRLVRRLGLYLLQRR